MNKKATLIIFVHLLFIISCDSEVNKPQQYQPNNLKLIEEITGNTEDDKSNKTFDRADTTFRDFYLEDTLNYGFAFGMTVTEWNKVIAHLTKKGVFNELSVKDHGANQAIMNENSNRRKIFDGIFAIPKEMGNGIEAFKRNEQIIDEPILIGLAVKYDVPTYDVPKDFELIIWQDELKFIAGFEIWINSEKLKEEDFKFISSSLYYESNDESRKFLNLKKPSPAESFSRNEEGLYDGGIFYSVISITEKKGATISRDIDGNFLSMENPYRYYDNLKQTIYSKKQSAINISDYLTYQQKEQINKDKKTKELMEKALDK